MQIAKDWIFKSVFSKLGKNLISHDINLHPETWSRIAPVPRTLPGTGQSCLCVHKYNEGRLILGFIYDFRGLSIIILFIETLQNFTIIIQSMNNPEHDDYYFGQFISNVPSPRMTNFYIRLFKLERSNDLGFQKFI